MTHKTETESARRSEAVWLLKFVFGRGTRYVVRCKAGGFMLTKGRPDARVIVAQYEKEKGEGLIMRNWANGRPQHWSVA